MTIGFGRTDLATLEDLADAIAEIVAEPRPPAPASVTFGSLSPSVLAALFAPPEMLAVTLDGDVEGVDADNPSPAADVMVATAEASNDVHLIATGSVTAADAGVKAVVRLLEEGEVIDEKELRSPFPDEPIPFTLQAHRTGPMSLGSLGYLDLDGGYGYTRDDASFHADDIRLRWLLEPEAWISGEAGVYRTLFAQYVDPNDRSLVVRLDEAGDLFVQGSVNGTALVAANLNLASADNIDLPVTGPLWMEVARRAGTGLLTVSIAQDASTWAVIDSDVLEAGSTLHESGGDLMLGGFKVVPPATGADSPLTGRVYAFEMAVATAGGPWTVVADPDFRTVLDDGPHTDTYGNVWRVAQ